jgi:iron complex outermembrane recepter protein
MILNQIYNPIFLSQKSGKIDNFEVLHIIDYQGYDPRQGPGRTHRAGPAKQNQKDMGMISRTPIALLLGSAALPLMFAAPARAQQAGATTPVAGEIVVTATKRSESLSHAPVSVSALSQDQLTHANVTAIKDLNATVPGLQLSTSGFVSSIEVTVRGISTNGIFQNQDPSVATYIDGVYVPRTQGLNGALYDLARVEVLRGPQGTLYGRNATAGSLNIITAPPTHSFDFNASVSTGNYGDVQTTGMINLPVSDTLAVRLAFGTHRNSGYYDTLGTTNERYGNDDNYSGRLSVLYTPTASFKWQVVVDDFVGHDNPPLSLSTPFTGDPYHQPVLNVVEPDNYTTNFGIRSRIDWTIADALTLSYVAGFQHVIYNNQQGSNVPSPQPAAPPYAAYAGISTGNNHNTSHEIDLSYDHGAISNIAGATFSFESNHNLADYAFYSYAVDVDFIVPDTTQRSLGVFDQFTWRPADTLRLTAGLRWSQDRKSTLGAGEIYCPLGSGFYDQQAFNPACYAATGEIYGRTGQWSKVSWKLGTDWDVAPRTLAYASVSTGYKAGGLNESNDPSALRYNPESVTNYEIGLKTHLAHNLLSLNTAAFYMDYRNLQVAQVGGLGGVITDNAARAAIYGLEAEAVVRPTPADRLDLSANYLHATYSDYAGAVNQQYNTPAGNLSGNTLPDAPRFTMRGRYEHRFDLPNGAALVPSATVYYQTKMYLREFNLPIDLVDAYTRSSAALRYDAAANWSIEGYVDNIENHAVRNAALTLAGLYLSYYNAPRTYGIRLTYHH